MLFSKETKKFNPLMSIYLISVYNTFYNTCTIPSMYLLGLSSLTDLIVQSGGLPRFHRPNKYIRDIVGLYIQSVLNDPFLTSSCGRSFEDINLRFFANCRRRMVVFFYMQHVVIYSLFFHWTFEKNNFTKKRTPVWILTMFSFDKPSLMSCYFYKNENIDMESFVSFS